jgi:hypothetical protein
VRQLAKILAPSSVVRVGRILKAKLSRSRRLRQKVR